MKCYYRGLVLSDNVEALVYTWCVIFTPIVRKRMHRKTYSLIYIYIFFVPSVFVYVLYSDLFDFFTSVTMVRPYLHILNLICSLAPRMAGFLIKLFTWFLESRIIGTLLLYILKRDNLIHKVNTCFFFVSHFIL